MGRVNAGRIGFRGSCAPLSMIKDYYQQKTLVGVFLTL
jgi:hypothetical protein